jgi:hypothetical protein
MVVKHAADTQVNAEHNQLNARAGFVPSGNVILNRQ